MMSRKPPRPRSAIERWLDPFLRADDLRFIEALRSASIAELANVNTTEPSPFDMRWRREAVKRARQRAGA